MAMLVVKLTYGGKINLNRNIPLTKNDPWGNNPPT